MRIFVQLVLALIYIHSRKAGGGEELIQRSVHAFFFGQQGVGRLGDVGRMDEHIDNMDEELNNHQASSCKLHENASIIFYNHL